MTDYKYRVYDGATGNEFGDVKVLSLALYLRDQLIEGYPQVTIDEIVPEKPKDKDAPLVPGDRVIYVGGHEPFRGHLGVVDDREVPTWNGTPRVGVTWDDDDKSGEAVTDLIRI